MQANLQILAQYGDFTFWLIWGQQKSDISQLVPQTSNGAFYVSYAERSLTCKFELNRAILDFDRLEVTKSPIFSQLVSETSNGAICVCYGESSLTCKFELNTAILDFDRFEGTKNPIFH